MSYTYIRREETLEQLVARALSQAECFVELYARSGPLPTGLVRHRVPRMLSRLSGRALFEEDDERCFEAVGQAMVDEANTISPGYGNRIRDGEADEDWIFNRRLRDLRDMICGWQSLGLVRAQVRHRLAAREMLRDI